MLRKLFGPKVTFKDALIILEKGLRNGEITVPADAEEENKSAAERADPEGSLQKLYVGNLPSSVTDAGLLTLFAPFGTVQSARVITDRDSEQFESLGLVEMASAQECLAAIKGINGRDVEGRKLSVARHRPAGSFHDRTAR